MKKAERISVALLHADNTRIISVAARIIENCPDIRLVANDSDWSSLHGSPLLADSIVLLDGDLCDGIATVDHVRWIRHAGARVIVVSRKASPSLAAEFIAAGADASLRKSDSSHHIADQIRLAEFRSTVTENRAMTVNRAIAS